MKRLKTFIFLVPFLKPSIPTSHGCLHIYLLWPDQIFYSSLPLCYLLPNFSLHLCNASPIHSSRPKASLTSLKTLVHIHKQWSVHPSRSLESLLSICHLPPFCLASVSVYNWILQQDWNGILFMLVFKVIGE